MIAPALLVLAVLLVALGAPLQIANADSHLGAPAAVGGGSARTLTSSPVWINVSSHVGPAPSPRSYAAMTFDPARGYVLLYGGTDGSGGSLNDTWEFDHGSWKELHPAHVPPSVGAATLAYDAADGYDLLFGGHGANTCTYQTSQGYCNQTWSFNGTDWTNLTTSIAPPARAYAAMTYDAAEQQVILAGGGWAENLSDLWSYRAGSWNEINYTPTFLTHGRWSSMAFDPLSNFTVYVANRGLGENQTYSYDNGTFTLLNLSAPPPAAWWSPGFAYDPALSGVVYLGGSGYAYQTGNWGNSTWLLSHSTWSDLTAQVGAPPSREGPSMTYDPINSALLLFGGIGSGDVALNDTWELNGSSSASGPIVWSVTASPPATDIGLPVTLLGNVSGGVGPLVYSWSGLPPGCTSADSPLLHCTPNGTGVFTILLTVTDSTTLLTGSGSGSLTVFARLTLSNFSADPNVVQLGSSTSISLVVSGGTPPIALAVTGLPPGCTFVNSTPIVCTPSAAGLFTPVASVADAVGGSASAATTLTVTGPSGPPPVITEFYASPNNLTLGAATVLTVITHGGALPLSYAYSSLPAGCVSANTPTLSCTPAVSGTFILAVTVTAADGQTDSSVTPLVVAAPPPGPLLLIGFVVYPPTVGPGNFSLFAVLTSGGVSPLSYVYAGLPPGCISLPLPLLPCRTSTPGTYVVQLTVTDSRGASVQSAVTLTVESPPGAGASPSGSSGPSMVQIAEYVGIGIAVGAAAATAVLLLARRRGRGPTTP